MRVEAGECTDADTPIVWQESVCPLCETSRYTPILEADDSVTRQRFLIVQCTNCGLAFTNPRPDASSIARFYPADYRCHRAKSRVRVDPWAHRLPKFGAARLLDFGCGAGDFLASMDRLGWNVMGLDRSEQAVAIASERGLQAHVGSLPLSARNGARFEAITMRQSLEHVHNPLEVLGGAHRLLTPGGTLLVTVPNFDCLARYWFGADWYGLDLPRHLTHFTPRSLRTMLEVAGFTRVALHQERHGSWIRHAARRRGARLLRTRIGSGLAAWWSYWWGRADSIVALASKS